MAMFVILVLMGLMFPPEVHGVDLVITSFVSNPESPVKDKEGTAENVTLQCQVNLPSTNLTSVTISYPNGVMTNATTTTTPPSPALYEITLSDVHPSNTGNYTCTASASTGSVPTTSQTYQLNVDIDECDSSTCGSNCDTCHTDATCTNTIGSYICTCNDGYSGNGMTCQDIDDCDSSTYGSNFDTCHTDATCTNTIGSYICACNAGYNGDGVTCQDIDECDSSTCGSNCDTCHTDATCTNTIGSYICVCNDGYSGNGMNCQDIDECDPSCSTNCDTCHAHATCTNTIGSYTCTCNDGYSGNGMTCQDIDECDSSTCGSNCDTCHTDATCDNTMGSYTCACNAGFSGDGVTCQECASNYYGLGCMSACTCVSSGNAVCDKVDGSCTCNKQFPEATCDKAMIAISTFEPLNGAAPIRDDSSVNDVNMRCHVNLAETDLRSVDIIFPDDSQNAMTKVQEGVWEYPLQDVHPINSGVYTCHATANPIPSGGVFVIRRTFDLTVTDVNECDENLDNCHESATCANDVGKFNCTCFHGFTGNGVQCTDIDECDSSTCGSNCDTCHTDATCTNTIGSYTCACNAGYSGNGVTCQECVEGKYGFNCAENCTCVDPMPGPNDVMCRKSDGFCECNKAEFIGKTCEKRNLTVTLMPDPNPVLDRPGIDNITWNCKVNLHSRDLVLPVTITHPNGSVWPMSMSEEGLYERIQSDVTPNDNGRYTCTATAVGMDPVTGQFDLDVLLDGRIISVSDPVEGEVGDTVRINCTVYARSDVDIAWYFGSNQIIDDVKYAITNSSLGDFEQISYLTVHNLIAADNGSYVCSATNDTREAMIVVIERPIIGTIQVSALRFDQLRVSWVISFDGNLPPPICHVNYSTTSTGLFLSSPGSPVTDVSHIVTDLQPYTEYYVQVQCTNKVGSSDILPGGPQRTLKTNPSEPRNLHATDIQPDRFNVEWVEPATKNGPVDGYKINVTRHSDGAIIKMAQVTGRSFPVEGLTAYTEYTVVVIAFNTEGGQDLASNPTQQIFRTAQDAPTPPRNVQSINLQGTCNVSWGRPENENGIIQSYKVIYSAYPRPESSENSAIDRDNSGSYNVNGNQMTFVFNKSNHAAYSEFRFNVSATTVAEGNPSDVSNGSCITDPAAPAEGAVSVPLQGTPDDPEEEAITPSSFYMTLTPADERNGPISCYNIIVKELNEDEGIDGLNPDQEYPQKKVGTYESSQGNREPYIAFVKDGSDVTSRLNIKIGEGRPTRCGAPGSRRKRQTMYDHFGDNGGLKADTRYTAFVRAFVKVRDGNSEEYRSSPFMQPIKTAAGPSVAGIAIGIILAILVIIVIVLGALIYMKRRQTTPLLRGEENGVAMVQVKDKEPEMTHMVVLPIPIEDLEEKVKQKSQNDDEVFKAEFKSIPEATGDVTRDATNLECNKEKNRYINIGAYDQTRVKLSVIDDVEGSDYINACYIDGYEKSRKFIAAQGPREDTVLDFWRMIWEQNCATIIMLTKCLENGREKCAEYWPEEDAIMYDDIIVTLDDVVTCADYVIRKFTMQKHIETEDEEDEDAEPIVGESRTLMQFHFLGWPDFGIPKYPHSMLCFVKRIRHMTGTRIEPGNIVVHCSAGVGRTGTYILIDYMLDMMKKEKKVDIYNVIYSLRSQRNLLVQSLVQYIFIHKALMEEYLYGHTEVDVGSMRHYYQKLCGKASDGEDTGVEKEYRAMASLPVDNTDQKTGNIEANKQKNRLRQVIPYDRNRVKLERLTGQEHSNYINASFIDGYEHKKAYVAAQGPLPNTMGDFWRMAWENQCSTIVMLSECEERGQNVCTKYWPEAGETLNPAFLTVAVKEVKEDDDCTIRDLEVSTTKGAGTKLIRQYHYHGWPEVGIPDNSASLVKVIGLAHEYQQDIGRFPILVHCSAGSGRTGVFIALSYLLQRAKAEGIVDVFQAVRTLRQQRPHMVQDVAQYQFCYRAMNEYLDSFDHYANFK